MLNPLGRNWGPLVNWDSLGKGYAAIAISWTVVLYSGVAWLVVHRRHPYLKMRNIPLAIAATTCLQIYLIKILLAYTTNGNFLCSAEFWIMSIYLPFGIALFQANMVQLLSISTQQKKLLDVGRITFRTPQYPRGIGGIWSRWRHLTSLKKTYVLIGIGMLLQVVITAAIYATNDKLQGHWGAVPKAAGQAKCRKGLEWIPSSFWQLFWSCVYGPYLLYRVKNIKDTHYWRLQTIVCVIAGIPGTPLWLSAVFSPAFKPINKWWVPPLWLAPGIFVMQAVTIFFPIYEHYTSNRLSKVTLDALQAWETQKTWDATTMGSGGSSQHRSTSDKSTGTSKSGSYKIYSMEALEKVLTSNPAPLLQFAATKDFTAENILFLIAVRDWRFGWATQKSRSMMFTHAAEIYANSVSETSAEFPINIEWSIKSRLDTIFGSSVSSESPRSAHFNDVVPFSEPGMMMGPLKSPQSAFTQIKESEPECFDETVFDAAERSIKYLVLTNTWRKYIGDPKSPRTSEDTLA